MMRNHAPVMQLTSVMRIPIAMMRMKVTMRRKKTIVSTRIRKDTVLLEQVSLKVYKLKPQLR